MANSDESCMIPTISHETALCIIPAPQDCFHVDRLREAYDKAHGKWPSHVNLIYPFVAPEKLPQAQKQIRQHIFKDNQFKSARSVILNAADYFEQKSNYTIFLGERDDSSSSLLNSLRTAALQALGHYDRSTRLHLTIGQSQDTTSSSQEFLLAKARFLPALNFTVGSLAILIREQNSGQYGQGRMRLWSIIELPGSETAWKPRIPEYWIQEGSAIDLNSRDEDSDDLDAFGSDKCSILSREFQKEATHHFNNEEERWCVYTDDLIIDDEPENVTVSSYNILLHTEFPPARDRDPLVVRNLLSDAAMADILVLQEVSDDFLSYLLEDTEVQRRYTFTSHGPPNQPDIGPLPSLRNIVILSTYAFSWKMVPFQRGHKSAVVAHFHGLTKSSVSGLQDLVVAGVHLTCGLTDGSVAAKKVQLQNLTGYLSRSHSSLPWIIAGDFNITTSSYTIDFAAKNKFISAQTVATLASLESSISDAGLLDTWSIARIEGATDGHDESDYLLFEGEAGATFDPRNNVLAAATSGTSNHRPQRYDRILLRSLNTVRVRHFNHFGFPEVIDHQQIVASDHSGVKASLKVIQESNSVSIGNKASSTYLHVGHLRVNAELSDASSLVAALAKYNVFPSEEEMASRQDAFDLLSKIVVGNSEDVDAPYIPLVVVPVGSYAMGVWTRESDIDCLCIGSISSKTFLKLVRQRLLKAEGQGIRIVRKVEANTGTMLELSVNGVVMDLHYCPARRVIERWADFKQLPATDDVFNLSMLSLRKLKPYRDLLYIQRTLPSLPNFRLAYRCIKLWAVQRGLYSSRFGYLSGIHITLMLSWVCKKLAHDDGTISAADIVASFFHYYSRFAWTNELVYDAFFHKNRPQYQKSAREPAVILGIHAPNANVAHTSTVPGLQILVKELTFAYEQLSLPEMTWEHFFAPMQDNEDTITSFLKGYNSFVKVDMQFWGRTLEKGKGLVGWVESRCLSLVVDIHKALPELNVRIWPARFTDHDANSSDEASDYHGCYLIGLSRADNGAGQNTKEETKMAKHALSKVVDQFVERLKSDTKNYDPSACWIGASLARSSDVKAFKIDDREWGNYAVDDIIDSDDEEGPDEIHESQDGGPAQRAIPQRHKPTATPLASSRLRPASDLLNRFRWDPSLDPASYIIGYEDRFLGAQEIGLEKWKSELTDDEFIPQHRILYFKKKADSGQEKGSGEIVWERATRIDKVFGSGAGAGAGARPEA